ncbi:MAG: hypothetical protein JSV30_05275 [Candidatus Omnitrophota bacterium]|nr:MAG: hypothetical protein JSV30_05275 [Candidatus Omnitrophota bacterium]
MKQKIVILTCICLFPLSAFASAQKHPPLTNETLFGTWEAISERDVRIFRIEINRKGDSFLSFGMHYSRSGVYKLVKKQVKDGEIFLEFRPLKKNLKAIQVIGKGLAGHDGLREEGIINADLIMDPEALSLNVWKLKFIKTPYIEELYDLSECAKDAIQEIDKILQIIEKELSNKKYRYRELSITDIEKQKFGRQKIRFTFLRNEDYFVGHVTLKGEKVIEFKLGKK